MQPFSNEFSVLLDQNMRLLLRPKMQLYAADVDAAICNYSIRFLL